MRNQFFAAIGILALAAVVSAQKPLEFEVASIKRSASDVKRVGLSTSPGGRFAATSVPLSMLITYAYRVQSYQVSGGPDWVTADRFDIVAKGDETGDGNAFAAERGDTPSRMQLMVRALLADRFKLVVRSETREMPVYALVTARANGKLGEALHRSAIDCSGPAAGTQSTCGIRMGLGKLSLGGASMTQVANTLSGLLERPVMDRTNLTGTFDATLTWTPDQATPGMALKAGYAPPGLVDPNGASIFTAVQEQLGLKLDAQKGPVDVLVIDRVEPPAED